MPRLVTHGALIPSTWPFLGSFWGSTPLFTPMQTSAKLHKFRHAAQQATYEGASAWILTGPTRSDRVSWIAGGMI
ncbi:hypothetical protein H9L39_08707 [Fusarium oxysporum f. sp. albedinis]|nr:hypothetical protein H9L39_08707 [Fusarium oxysporum f. sp. albedinis]